jgi:hypothetical protein
MRTLVFLLLVVRFASVVAAEPLALPMPLTVTEPAGVARQGAPVSGGIPLPWGVYPRQQAFAVFDGDDEIPVQVSPLVVDAQGFLRWILVDFQTELQPGQLKKFTLEAKRGSARPARVLRVTDTADVLNIDTGKIAFTISKTQPFSLFSSVSAGGKPVVVGGTVTYTDVTTEEERTYVAGQPASVEVEYVGPLRVTVAVRGRFQGDDQTKLHYVTRITAWAGRSDVQVKHTLANSNPDHYCYRRVKDPTIQLALAGKVERTLLGGNQVHRLDGCGWLEQGLTVFSHYQEVPDHSRIGQGDRVLWTGSGRAQTVQGWIAAETDAGTAYAVDLHFAEDPARRIGTGTKTLILNAGPQRYPGRPDRKWPDKGNRVGVVYEDDYRWIFDCTHFSSHYVLDFAAAGAVDALAARSAADQQPLHALAPLNWYAETEGLPLGKFGTQADELAAYRNWGWQFDETKAPRAPGRSRGRFVRGEDNHYETEEDVVEVLLLMYLRTGSRPFLDSCRAWANYNMDLQTWRTDEFRWEDGGVWWQMGGPLGNRPQRREDPVTNMRNNTPAPWSKDAQQRYGSIIDRGKGDLRTLSDRKRCYCHNWGAGLAAWYCLTGERDAFQAVIDDVEQDLDFHRRVRGWEPGEQAAFSRAGVRATYVAQAARLVAPGDPLAVEASDFFGRVFVERPEMEPRGFVNPAGELSRGLHLEQLTGGRGAAVARDLGLQVNTKTGLITDAQTGRSWYPLTGVNSFMYPTIAPAMELYYRLSRDERALDWLIAYGQFLSRVMWQEHGQQAKAILVDFPQRGVCKDVASWVLPPAAKNGEGYQISGYLARFNTDTPARAYYWSGEPLLKQRNYDYWNHGSHRGYHALRTSDGLGKTVGQWANYYGPHTETAMVTARTFYVHGRPREDQQPPSPITDLQVTVDDGTATVSFTAPPDTGGGTVARYQVKCSDKPIVAYSVFLDAYNRWKHGGVTNWWMAGNLDGEPSPKSAGTTEKFTLSNVPEGARYFAVRSFDDSHNRSGMSNVAQAE